MCGDNCGTACAHVRVHIFYEHEGVLTRCGWRCRDCPMEFVPKSRRRGEEAVKLSTHVRRVILDPILAEDVAEDIEVLEARIEALEQTVAAKQNIIKSIQRVVNDHLEGEAAIPAYRPDPVA
jgi:hypothetical protein